MPLSDVTPASIKATEVLAFPGAEGGGRHARGGGGGRVYTVTQLGDGGPGSLREAVEASGPRTVVFAVSGTIVLTRPLVVRQGRLTIAGQTAPGDGITLRDYPFEVAADDVVVRYLRSRMGDERKVDGDAMGVIAGRRIILDHVSASWSTDEVLSTSARFDTPERSFDAVTVQWSFITESLNHNRAKKPGETHGFGTLLRAAKGARVSFHHNLWAHHDDRMPRPGNWHAPEVDPVGPLYDFRNNVFYDWGRERSGYNLDRAARSSYNFAGNTYLRGPSSKGAYAFEESSPASRAFFAGNTMDFRLPADPWSLVRAHREHLPRGLPEGYRLPAPLDVGPVATEPAPVAYARVLAHAGAAKSRDEVDLRIVQQVRQRTGRLVDRADEVGGWPALKSTPAPADRDGDGMPDDWERTRGLDPDDPADGSRIDPRTGITALEAYLNSLVPEQASTLGPLATLHPALHLVGDSTMADKVQEPPNPEFGWGMLLRERLREPQRLLNHAMNGRSTKNFRDEGRWDHVLSQLAPGDMVLIQFGHNDARRDDPKRFADPAAYRENLVRYVREVRALGAVPLLATSITRRQFDASGRLVDTHGDYPVVMREVAQAEGVVLLDLYRSSAAHVQQLGVEGSKPTYQWLPPGQWARFPQGRTDNTHFSRDGARAMAALAEEALRVQVPALAGWWK